MLYFLVIAWSQDSYPATHATTVQPHIHIYPCYLLTSPYSYTGINYRWAADGHDKLKKIGFPIWAVVDDATGKWLGAWVVPCNRMSDIIGYLFLDLVETMRGG